MSYRFHNAGFVLIEAMITLLIVVFGLLGLIGLQTRMMTAEMESYQRSQAIILANDMAQRIMANPKGAPCYDGQEVAGSLASAPTCDAAKLAAISDATVKAAVKAQVDNDLTAWHNTLLGAAEKSSGTGVGAMIGARGCIKNIDDALIPGQQLLVTTAWQGLIETAATPVSCGKDAYTNPGTGTVTDKIRRTVSIAVYAAKLND